MQHKRLYLCFLSIRYNCFNYYVIVFFSNESICQFYGSLAITSRDGATFQCSCAKTRYQYIHIYTELKPLKIP